MKETDGSWAEAGTLPETAMRILEALARAADNLVIIAVGGLVLLILVLWKLR